MPDNTWFTPYKLPASRCLSLGPSQGIVYELNQRVVIKLPFQYPIDHGSATDASRAHLCLSLRSLALHKKECRFYDLLASNPHPNIVQRIQSELKDGILLEYLHPIEEVWRSATKDMRNRWIQQLLNALVWVEKLGYVHGDVTIRNMGVDHDSQLKLFDFGSIVHSTDEDFDEQVLDDHFSLATCIHFLASGVDPLAEARSLTALRRIRRHFEQGTFIVEKEAGDLQQVIQAGWMQVPRSSSSFLDLQETVASILGGSVTKNTFSSQSECLSDLKSISADLLLSQAQRDLRWMDEEKYRSSWRERGYEVPEYI